ncbi:hypothetical protein PCANC_10694 [Puccinia coronata f. sp. avenae]|uniref:Uncharacterized protein n=1 Tax=Puccinia coronata f. sp. avenae TaxID=200324 RepID=A0A2N5VG60_9BASI|nr:hypothetical protein PCASD_10871 [Puccinia coronata f. sp. avenae]PLW48981.1 hypothetical protein PCANC_10694 [Puccinia coronata f. sp. avenae]
MLAAQVHQAQAQEHSRPRSYSHQNTSTTATLAQSHLNSHLARHQPNRPVSAALQSSIPGYGFVHQSLIPHSLMIPTVYAFNQQLVGQQQQQQQQHQYQQPLYNGLSLFHSSSSFPELAHQQNLPFHSQVPTRNLHSSSTPIFGPPPAPMARPAHPDHFTPCSATAAAASSTLTHHRHPSSSLHPHHLRSQSRSLSASQVHSSSANPPQRKSHSPSPTSSISSAPSHGSVVSNTHHPSTFNNQMYGNRHPAANTDPPSPSRFTSPLSGSSGFPPGPRSRTQSAQSDRSSPFSHPGSAPKPPNGNNVHRVRTDSQNSHHSISSHGFPNGPSGYGLKPAGSLNEPQFTFNSSPTARSSTAPPPNLSPSSIPPSSTIQGRPSSPSTHSFNPPNPNIGNMVRRSSPLAQSNHSPHHSSSVHQTDPTPRQPAAATTTTATTTATTTSTTTNTSTSSSSASYRHSSASTVTITPAPSSTVSGNMTTVPAIQPDEEVDEDSDTTSDVDHRPPGHRSTPGTSVDSSTSNFTQPEDVPSANKSTSVFPDRTPQRHSKHSLSNKLRRALTINSMHDNMGCDSIPELDPVGGNERLKSSSASIAGVPSSPSIANKAKSGRQPGSSRRFGFLNSKNNSSTDNLSISSTVSSASVMIRKLGNLGKSARTKGVMGLTKIFKDKNDAAAGESSVDDKLKRASANSQQKNLASTSVAQVQAEVDRSLSAEFPGMTPAAAFIHKQKQQYAQQEAAAAAAAAASASAALNQQQSSDSVRSKGRAGSVGSAGSLTPGSASEARKKMIEKEKEKIKSKKSRKWGFSTLGSSSSGNAQANLPVSASVEDLHRSSEPASDAEDNEDWDDNTVRGPAMEGLIEAIKSGPPKSIEELRDDDDDEALDEYDMESLYGHSSSVEGSSTRRTGLKPRPSREAVPKKGILKNAQNFSQEQHLSPVSFQSKPISAATTPDSPKPQALAEDLGRPAQSQPASGVEQQQQQQQQQPVATIDFGGEVPDLKLSIAGADIKAHIKDLKDRRATFAQHLSVHTTWPPAIYDRRGELATCNRLTPTLAQRIKEEINAFKMEEMEVHYASRVHTHFFV